ncbi:hypothetical protein HMPREF2708_06030 [Corynebacterium sp. HMSC073H12]|uniref:hypothetical protein n=1 Tax=Corynebacterium sp. HMSC073H12 TaxID=1715187 RepID=UPI0008A8BCED|nr:hypothetical protein [Corynebacterium sp. HMSC073H12]OHQ76434.1 hypothetical protein HMPREF2708_06030 [Corynebacterium sp. HMSC073H12]
MIPLVFTLAAILIIAAVALFVVDRRRRSTSETAVASPSSPSLYDEPSDSTGEVTGVAAEDVVSEQPDSSGQGSSETASVVRPNVATGADSEVVAETDGAAEVDSETEFSTTELGASAGQMTPAEPESVSGIEPAAAAEMSEATENAGASETSGTAADLNAGTDGTLRSDAESGAEFGTGSGAEPAESVTAEDTDTVDEPETGLVGDTSATEANSTSAADARTGTVDGTEFQAASVENTETGEVPQSSDFAAHAQAAQATQPAQPTEPTQLVQPQRAQQKSVAPVRRRISGRRVRHLRKAWAQERNSVYNRVDHELPSYWQRTPDGDAKAVVSGFAFGREMHLADVGGITTIAIRRSVSSDEVFELRRSGGTTLPHVATEAGLVVAATDPELIHRIFDDRATRMLADVHPAITRMWSENSWSLAQLIDNSVPEDWDGALASLSDFSDIARRLPPAQGETVAPDTNQWDPTRLQLTEQSVDSGSLISDGTGRGHLQAVPDQRRNGSATHESQDHTAQNGHAQSHSAQNSKGEEPLDVEEIVYADSPSSSSAATVDATTDDSQRSSQSNAQPTVVQAIDGSSWRPTRDIPLDPTALPSRSTARKMGANVGESEDFGDSGQQIPALGEDPEHSRMRSSRGRVVRSNVKPASIFTDAAPDLDSSDDPTESVSGDKGATPDSADE